MAQQHSMSHVPLVVICDLLRSGDYPAATVREVSYSDVSCSMSISGVTVDSDGVSSNNYIVPFMYGVPGAPIEVSSISASSVSS